MSEPTNVRSDVPTAPTDAASDPAPVAPTPPATGGARWYWPLFVTVVLAACAVAWTQRTSLHLWRLKAKLLAESEPGPCEAVARRIGSVPGEASLQTLAEVAAEGPDQPAFAAMLILSLSPEPGAEPLSQATFAAWPEGRRRAFEDHVMRNIRKGALQPPIRADDPAELQRMLDGMLKGAAPPQEPKGSRP